MTGGVAGEGGWGWKADWGLGWGVEGGHKFAVTYVWCTCSVQ